MSVRRSDLFGRSVPGTSREGRRGRPGWRSWSAAAVVAGIAVLGVVGPTLGHPGGWQATGREAVARLSADASRSGTTPALPRLGAGRPAHSDDVGDPYVLPVPQGTAEDRQVRYVLLWTTDWQSNVPTAVSEDLVHWRRVADALPVLPTWATGSRTMTWGPSAVQVPAGWALYYSTQEASSGLECLGRAVALDPAGPYVDRSSRPLVCQRSLGGDIDPSVVRDDRGALSLVWKNDGNARGSATGIWHQSLSADGLSLTGAPRRLLVADQRWEHGILEGPAMLRAAAGGWWLFYSAGAWQSNTYSTGVAWCVTVDGPCRKSRSGPLLTSAPGAISPGGLETFTDHAGRLWASYSAFPSRPASRAAAMAENRVLLLAPVLTR